ncbi:MAG: primosomal protein N' [Candidatus Portnoybacteria bacterium]|nr:primosomal protein N' [Candidatus Portnoybacteria bacterium]
MYIYDIVPLTAIPRPNPQVLSYYCAKKLNKFTLVEIPLGKKFYPGILLGGRQVKDLKSVLRKAYFQVKEVKRVLYHGPILFDWQFTLAKWITDYYWSSLGLVLKKFIPRYLYQVSSIEYRVLEKGRKEQILWLFPDNSFFQKVELPLGFIRISSRLTDKKEFQIFKKIASEKERIIIGTKRALFAPYNTLREIHIFEEADQSHKSWEQHPKYNAVRVAQELAKLHGAKVIYRSTLPSLERYYKTHGYYQSDESYSSKLRNVNISSIDLTKEKLKKPFSGKVEQALKDSYLGGKQAILYVNRRGEGRFLLCRDCSFVPKCPHCELSLVFHTNIYDKRILLCHHCGYKEAPPSLCSQCGSHEIRSYGFGTQRVEKELLSLFPKAKVFRLDSDTARGDSAKQDIVEQFRLGGNFLVATSMLFQTSIEPVCMTASLNADSELNIPDFAQTERLFFNLWRLRYFARDLFYIQTYNPANPVFEHIMKNDWQGFYKKELEARKMLNYPPFSSIIKLTFTHRNESRAREESEVLYKKLQRQAVNCQLSIVNCQFLGPAPAFLAKLKGKYRYNILLKLKANEDRKLKANLLLTVPPSWDVDIDPIDSL